MPPKSETKNSKRSQTNRAMPSLDLARFYPARQDNVRKGDFGRVIISGGSERYAGCLAFNALAALRAGADLSIVVAPRRAADIVAGYSPDLITVPCDSSFPDPGTVQELLERADSLVVGCGVERTREAHRALHSIVRRCKCPVVADAETLHALVGRRSLDRGKHVLLTPNAGEFQILAGKPWPNSPREKSIAVRALARSYGATVIMKGSLDYISDGEQVHIDKAGSPYMTKGGYGDLLAGVAGAMLARKCSAFDAAAVAAYVVGRAGELASRTFGESMMASDLLPFFPQIVLNGRRP